MGLFKKRKIEEPIPPALQILPPQNPFSGQEELDQDDELDSLEEEEENEEKEVEEQEESEELEVPVPIPEPKKVIENIGVQESEDTLDSEMKNLQKKIDDLKKKKEAEDARKIQEELERQKQNERPVNFERSAIATFQNHEERIRNLEAALFRVRSSI